MIINENLSNQDRIILDAKNLNFRFGEFILDNLGLVDGEAYTFSAIVSLSEGQESTIIVYNNDYSINSGSSRFSTKKRNSFTFVFKKDVTTKIACYAGIHGSTSSISAEYTNIKLEKGDQMTPYLPHKSKVKAENQAIFPIGGGYHEVYPL